MKSEAYQIIQFRPEFRDAVIELQAHLWRRDQATRAAYFDWKYVNNPYTDDINIYLAFKSQQLVGMVGAHGARWQAGSSTQTAPGPCFADLVIHPDHREGNLSSKLTAFALEDLSTTHTGYAFGFSAYSPTALILLFQGWRALFVQTASYTHVDPVPPRAPSRWLRRLMQSPALRRLTSSKRAFAALDARAKQAGTTTQVTLGLAPRPREMAVLAGRLEGDGRIRHVRDEAYFEWRLNNPLSEYRFLYADDGRLKGYLVLCMLVGAPGLEGHVQIVDWDVSDEQTWRELLEATMEWGAFQRINIWSASLPESAREVLREKGFEFRDKTGSAIQDIDGTLILIAPAGMPAKSCDWTLGDRNILEPTHWDLRASLSDAF